MNALVPITLAAWIPVVLLMFASLPPRRAVILAFVSAWLFLPMAGFAIRGLPDYTKMSATCAGVMLGAAIFDPNRLLAFRPRWYDTAIVVFGLCPILSSVTNDLGLYDGVSSAMRQSITWGMPYLIGRLYFTEIGSLRDLAIGLFLGGIVYAPLCLFEIRMSPQLHHMFYGYHAHSFAQTMRFGGWRPTVFMEHGLMVGMWMAMAALVGVWLWMCGSVKHVGGVAMWLLVPGLVVTAVLCKSTGAVLLLVAGLAVLWTSFATRTRVWLVVLILVAPLYIGLRIGTPWDPSSLVDQVRRVDADRAQSVEFRVYNENLLIGKAMQRPLFGWGGWGRNRVYDSQGRDMTVIDGQWINILGINGLVGMGALVTLLLLPGVFLVWRVPAQAWATPQYAPAVALVMVSLLYLIDNLPNAMINPVFVMIAGALSCLAHAGEAPATTVVRQEGKHLPGQGDKLPWFDPSA